MIEKALRKIEILNPERDGPGLHFYVKGWMTDKFAIHMCDNKRIFMDIDVPGFVK